MSFHVKTVAFYTLKKENLFFFNLLPFWSKWQQSVSESEFAGQNLSCSPAQLSRFNPAKQLCGSCLLHPKVLQARGIFPAWPLFHISGSSSWISNTVRCGWGDVQLFLTVALWSKPRLRCRERAQLMNGVTDPFPVRIPEPRILWLNLGWCFPLELPGHWHWLRAPCSSPAVPGPSGCVLALLVHHSIQLCRWIFGITSEPCRNVGLYSHALLEKLHGCVLALVGSPVQTCGVFGILELALTATWPLPKLGLEKHPATPSLSIFPWTAWHTPFSSPFLCSKSCSCWQAW